MENCNVKMKKRPQLMYSSMRLLIYCIADNIMQSMLWRSITMTLMHCPPTVKATFDVLNTKHLFIIIILQFCDIWSLVVYQFLSNDSKCVVCLTVTLTFNHEDLISLSSKCTFNTFNSNTDNERKI